MSFYLSPTGVNPLNWGRVLRRVLAWKDAFGQPGLAFATAVFLVSVPVFIQAPLVRSLPWVSLGLTLGWLGSAKFLWSRPTTRLWGDLLLGFTGSWWAGSIYWGWMRWEPYLHLPIEALALPLAILGLTRPAWRVGSSFYLGSLLGTVITDIYFYLVDLIPHWRHLMQVTPELATPIFQQAIAQVETPWGVGCAVMLATILLLAGFLPLRSRQVHGWTFSGAILGTLLVDGLFWLAAGAA